ncbi:MAG: polyhydroxyalkanoate synthesis repressor PhaR [Alphaproteobacteria bacterium]|nr:polyhydroxyalkanoate synthesis repressor PhaR [Alphaproteobacteria bacterium]
MADKPEGAAEPIIIKKYANRRLYNTATSSYVTLEHLCEMVKKGEDFVVYDAKSGDDITRSVLTQIIFEEEGKGQNMLPISFLRQIIGFYGDSLQHLVPSYLELSMSAFTKNQEQMRNYLAETFGGMNPFKNIEEISRQNMAMMQRAMSMFNPFAGQGQAPGGSGGGEGAGAPPSAPGRQENDLSSLKSRLEAMQRQLDELAKKKD